MPLHWILCLIAIFPMWLLQNVIHELAHGLTMLIGWRWNFKIFPFPSTKLGRFTWSHVTYSPSPKSKEILGGDKALVAIMPKIANLCFIAASIVGSLLAFKADFASLSCLLAMFGIFNYMDAVVGLGIIFRHDLPEADIWQFQAYSNISAKVIKGAVIAFIVLFGLMLGVTGGYIAFRV